MNKEETRMVASIYESITGLFNEENELYIGDLRKVDLTQFFTGAVKALYLFYKQLTDDERTLLEFTHLMNHLVVQDLIEKKEGEVE